ncbi:hypothetical protein [Dictyobacter arantiisoli]|uniref:DUF4352 domain-containing protein n=1 Tax=Dictyobacter arantiisoli TaxID=2014874 RepID=A0A5A5TAJ3_9CHLR|nr:hypothetical protein [Dictyobacter arantiisoli]GCF08033.1 hypothetical protein KDI_15970 [Dictyobacter arantiisoli]
MEHITKNTKKRSFISRRWGTILGLIVIAIAVVSVLLSGPHEVEHDSLFAPPAAATIVVTNQVADTALHQTYVYQDVHLSFTRATLASKFSDDFKLHSKYVVRVYLDTTNTLKDAIGVDYVSLTSLILPNGTKVGGKLASINAAVYPGEKQSGYIDFPLNEKIDLTRIQIQFNNTVLA